MRMKNFLLVLAAALVQLASFAQGDSSVEFPPSSTVPTAPELKAHLSGKSFRARYADGTMVQTKFDADGGLAATAPDFYDTGRWRVENGKVCGSLRKEGDFCNDARLESGALYLRSMSGEVVRYEPQ